MTYFTSLSLDVFSYLVIEELGGALHLDKPFLQDDYANLSRSDSSNQLISFRLNSQLLHTCHFCMEGGHAKILVWALK